MGESSVVISRTDDFIKVRTPSGSEDVYYSAFYEGIPEEFQLEAQKTLNETEENRQKGMKLLRAFAKREDLQCTDDDLVLVLRSCKYNLKKAEKKLKSFLGIRQKFVNLVSNMDDSKTKLILDDMIFGVLPYRDKYGRIILYARSNLHLDLYEFDELDPFVFGLVLYLLTFPLTSVMGGSYIGDSKTDNMLIFYPILKQFKKTYIGYMRDLPARFGRVDFTNTHFLLRWSCSILRPIIPEKVLKRMNFHDGSKTLLEHYDPEILPEEFGGKLGPLSDKHFRERLLRFIQNVKEENKSVERNQ